MKKQNGFAALEGVLILVIVGLIGFIGWYVWHSKQNTDKALTNANQTSHSTPPTIKSSSSAKTSTTTSATTPEATTSEQYLVIKEWGVKIKMTDANKATYTYVSTPGTDTAGAYNSYIKLAVSPKYLVDKSCEVSVGMSRYTNPDADFVSHMKKIGNYYYSTSGSPYMCENKNDDNLNKSLRTDFTTDNLQSI